MTLYFFERVSDDDFIGPVIAAAPSEDEAWTLLATRERSDRPALEALGWQVAQELPALPARAAIVYPGPYRGAILR
jgi:hypothetical protein